PGKLLLTIDRQELAANPLPPLENRFELITTYRICFNNPQACQFMRHPRMEILPRRPGKTSCPRGRIWLEFKLTVTTNGLDGLNAPPGMD
ncbi:MAG TPA: hypothetical protein VEI58_01735, partial [Chthoniobacterales bacterium]|nr:hypothetical protein [Chthoniobacterales bacterium]